MLQRFSTGLISGEFGGRHVFSIKFGRFFLHHAWVALAACAGAPSWTNVMHVAIGTAQFPLVRLLHSRLYGEGQASNMLLMW